jgi:hypothetical protein
MELAPFVACATWLPGFHRASPSTPLDASSYVIGSIRTVLGRGKIPNSGAAAV